MVFFLRGGEYILWFSWMRLYMLMKGGRGEFFFKSHFLMASYGSG